MIYNLICIKGTAGTSLETLSQSGIAIIVYWHNSKSPIYFIINLSVMKFYLTVSVLK